MKSPALVSWIAASSLLVALPVPAQSSRWLRVSPDGFNPQVEIDTTRTSRNGRFVESWARFTFSPPIALDTTRVPVSFSIVRLHIDCELQLSAALSDTWYGSRGQVIWSSTPRDMTDATMAESNPDSIGEQAMRGACAFRANSR